MKYKILKFIATKFRAIRKPYTKEERIRIIENQLYRDDDVMITIITSSCGGGYIGSLFGGNGVIIGAIVATTIRLYFRYKNRQKLRKLLQELRESL